MISPYTTFDNSSASAPDRPIGLGLATGSGRFTLYCDTQTQPTPDHGVAPATSSHLR